MNRQEIAENATSALTGVTALRNRLRCRVAFADRAEDFKFDRGLDCFSQLVCIDRIEEAFWNRLLDWYGHEFFSGCKELPHLRSPQLANLDGAPMLLSVTVRRPQHLPPGLHRESVGRGYRSRLLQR
jgi:hypothetical protein